MNESGIGQNKRKRATGDPDDDPTPSCRRPHPYHSSIHDLHGTIRSPAPQIPAQTDGAMGRTQEYLYSLVNSVLNLPHPDPPRDDLPDTSYRETSSQKQDFSANEPSDSSNSATGTGSHSDQADLLLSDEDYHLLDFPNAPPKKSGGSCEVYLAVYRPNNVVLAMKRPRCDFPTEDMLRRFRREAEIWSTFKHANVLPFFGTLKISHRLYLISPWMPLGDLLAFVQNHVELIQQGKDLYDESIHPAHSTFSETRIIQEIAAGLGYLHDIDVIHGDMKAKNVLLNNNGCAQICDFGLTKTLDHAVTSTDLKGVGSLRWQSPELLYDAPKSSKSDVYAFGMTIAEVLTGNYPFPHLKQPMALLFAIMSHNERPAFRPLSRLGVDFFPLWKLAARCWQTEAEDRPLMGEVLREVESMGLSTKDSFSINPLQKRIPSQSLAHPCLSSPAGAFGSSSDRYEGYKFQDPGLDISRQASPKEARTTNAPGEARQLAMSHSPSRGLFIGDSKVVKEGLNTFLSAPSCSDEKSPVSDSALSDPDNPFYLPTGTFQDYYNIPHWTLPPRTVLSRTARYTLGILRWQMPIIHNPTFRLDLAHEFVAFALSTIGMKGIPSNSPEPQERDHNPWHHVPKVVRSEKSETLVKVFMLRSPQISFMESFAIVQALIFHRLPDLLSKDSADRTIAQSFLATIIQIARKSRLLIPRAEFNMADGAMLNPGCEGDDDLEAKWNHWIHLETIRRTIWLLYLLDTCTYLESSLEMRIAPWELRYMALPAPSYVWEANSAYEWAVAMRHNDAVNTPLDTVMNKTFHISPLLRVPPGNRDESRSPASNDCLGMRLRLGSFARTVVVLTMIRGLVDFGEGKRQGGLVTGTWVMESRDLNANLEKGIEERVLITYQLAFDRWRRGWDFDELCDRQFNTPPEGVQPLEIRSSSLVNDAMPYYSLAMQLMDLLHHRLTTEGRLGVFREGDPPNPGAEDAGRNLFKRFEYRAMPDMVQKSSTFL